MQLSTGAAMGSTAATPTRANEDVDAAAKVIASLTGRAVAEQLSRWARIGSEVNKRAAGKPAITLDEDGNVVRRLPDGTIDPL